VTIPATDPKASTVAESMYRRIVRNFAVLAGGTAASSVFMMLAVATAARALNAHDFGVLVLLQSSVLMLRSLTSFSTQQPVIKLGADAQAIDDKHRLGSIISMGLMMDFAASVLAFAIGAALVEFSRASIGLANENVGSAWIVAASLVFSGYPTSNGVFRLYDRFGLLSIVQTAGAALLLIAYGALFLAAAKLQAYVWAWAVNVSLVSIVQLLVAMRLLQVDGVRLRWVSQGFLSADGRALLHYCWSTWGTSTADSIRTNGDSLLVGAVVSVEAAGVYNVARQLAGLLRKFTVIYPSAVFPEISKLAARHDVRNAKGLENRLMWTSTAIGAAAVVAVLLLGRFIVQFLFGTRFIGAHESFVILTAAAAAQLIGYTPSMYVQVYRGPRLLLLLYVIATAAFAAAAVPLTLQFSITGMAIAQLFFGVVLIVLCKLALRDFQSVAEAPHASEALSTAAEMREG